jgi:replication-associated recombination protein RarA
MIVGHEAARAELERSLPPVTLLLGPKSVGKMTLANHLALHHKAALWTYRNLSAAVAREVVESAPVRRARAVEVSVIDLDGATDAAQNILLKVLEEPPGHCRFILVASRPPLPTIDSRARTYRLGLLTDDQVYLVLRQSGASEHEAAMAAARGRGQVAPALDAVADKESSRVSSVVSAAVRAAASGGGPGLDMALRNWTPEHTVVLRRWATEAASGRWAIFTPEFGSGVAPARAMRLLEVMSEYPEARTGAAVALAALKSRK